MGLTIRSLAVTSEYEAIYDGPDGTFIREPIVGFAVVADIDGDEIRPVVLGDLGIDFCEDTSNYRCLVRRGWPVPERVVPEVPA